MHKKTLLAAITYTLIGTAPIYAANYDSSSHSITLNNVQGLNKNAPTFNTAANLQATDNAALHKGQTYKIASTGVAIGNPDARYTVEDNQLTIPNLLQDATTTLTATLQLTNPTTGELTVLEVGNMTLGTQGTKGDPGPQGPAGKDGAPGTFPAGTAKGDMQYWDGSKWAMIPAGNNGTYLVFCDGKPVWGNCKTTPTPAPSAGYKIGDTGPMGGKVFYVDSTLKHGLEAQAADYNNRQPLAWSDAIIAGTSYGEGWHLPMKDELSKLYQYRSIVGGFAGGDYWSATEYGASLAWFQNFSNGSQFSYPKSRAFLVRAVRAF
jgi:hypothetical protein